MYEIDLALEALAFVVTCRAHRETLHATVHDWLWSADERAYVVAREVMFHVPPLLREQAVNVIRHLRKAQGLPQQVAVNGWQVQVCPKVNHLLVEPNVLVEKEGERIFVEVKVLRNSRKRREGADNSWVRKWINQYHLQSKEAVCTPTPKRMRGILRYLKPCFPGEATELSSLAKQPESDLWLERW